MVVVEALLSGRDSWLPGGRLGVEHLPPPSLFGIHLNGLKQLSWDLVFLNNRVFDSFVELFFLSACYELI